LNENSTDDPRAAIMRAMAVANQLTAVGPIQSLDAVTTQRGAVRVMLHRRPEDVAQWARLYGLPLALETNYNDGLRPYIEASGLVVGVPVSVWALGGADEQERYAACMPASDAAAPGLPAEWSAAGVA
jgi:hypothetical protein